MESTSRTARSQFIDESARTGADPAAAKDAVISVTLATASARAEPPPLVSIRRFRAVTALACVAWLLAGCALPAGTSAGRHGVTEIDDFGAPGSNLRAYEYVPSGVGTSPPMVVVLHHCFRNAVDYLENAGWRGIADRYGIVLLLPEQSPVNNPLMCFNFGSGAAQVRHQGESGSIRAMIDHMVADHGIDRQRIFVTGMSAGGSMALLMMALYPELFAGGGVLASFPFGCAVAGVDNVLCPPAGGSGEPAQQIGAATQRNRPWARLQVWTGDSDGVISPGNADRIVRQWTALRGIPDAPAATAIDGRVRRSIYRDQAGIAAVELIVVAGMGHAVPVDLAHGCGPPTSPGMFVADVGICSSEAMVRFWGLRPIGEAMRAQPDPREQGRDPRQSTDRRTAAR